MALAGITTDNKKTAAAAAVVRHSSPSPFLPHDHHNHHQQQHHHTLPTRRRVSALLPPSRANSHLRRFADKSQSTPTTTKVNMATMASAVRDITTTSLGRDNLTAVAARSVPVTATHPIPLPTPPNSISPTLPPHGLKAQLQRARMDQHVDSDLDLHGDHDTDHHGSVGSPPYESAGINAAMLAKFHLPEILLNHGPLAIRHIMGYLTSSIPGFAEIPPTKARRLVVGALEGRGSGGEGGGLDGDVQFEKVGWGIWQARKRGQPPSGYTAARRASPHGDGEPASIPIARHGGWNLDRLRTAAAGSLDGESCAAFSFDDRSMHMMDHEADRMSLDGSVSASCSEAPDDDEDMAMDEDTEDATDDEDWAAVGAAALRATSYQAPSDWFLNASSVYSSGGLRSFSSSVGMARSPQFRSLNFATTPALTTPSDAQEREAVEALLRLGSV